jgi:hypothetical protein
VLRNSKPGEREKGERETGIENTEHRGEGIPF